MKRAWTFGEKVTVGFTLAFAMLVLLGTVSYVSLSSLARTTAMVQHTHIVQEHIAGLLSQLKDAETGHRGFIITGDPVFLEPYLASVPESARLVKDLRRLTNDNPVQQKRLDEAEEWIGKKLTEMKRTIEIRKNQGFEAAQKIIGAGVGREMMDNIRRAIGEMDTGERELLRQRAEESESTTARTKATIILVTLSCLLFLLFAGFVITRSLTRQIGSAVQHIQSSSGQLQAAANQQTSGSREQVTSMNEINTTSKELVSAARQIGESAQHVSKIAEATASSARSGELTLQKAQEAITAIKRQVDLIVSHMLDLGKKSQQIGGILEIINELAEQTNILSINATIEATGAGEFGKRFSVVADEIRKLADRVGGSTKDIRTLIEEIRSAVHTTVMATESGSKAVDAGTKQFGDVASAFQQIVNLVSTSTQAAREIELSTKQQTTSIEQVNVAISNIAQSAKESEASSTQTLQTVSELTSLSRDLARLIQPQSA